MKKHHLIVLISTILFTSHTILSARIGETGQVISLENASQIEPSITIQAEQLESVLDVTISNDDSKLLLRNNFDSSLLELWTLEDSSLQSTLIPLQDEPIWHVEFSNDDMAIAIQQDKLLQVWNTNSGSVLASIDGRFSQMRMFPIDYMLAYVGLTESEIEGLWDGDDYITVYDYANNAEVLQLDHMKSHLFDINQDGSKLISASSDGSIRLWDISIISEEPSYTTIRNADNQTIFTLGFVDENLFHFSLSDDRSFHLWDYESNQAVEPRYQIDTSPIDKTIFQTRLDDLSSFQIWDASANRDLMTINELDYHLMDVSSNLQLGISIPDSKTVELVNIATGDILKSIEMNCEFACSAALSHDDSYLATWGEGNIVTIWTVPD